MSLLIKIYKIYPVWLPWMFPHPDVDLQQTFHWNLSTRFWEPTNKQAGRHSGKSKKIPIIFKVFWCSLAVVLSSDDEEEADNASTGSVSRLDSVSPRPADSAHSSPAPSGGRVEAAVKSAGEQEELSTAFFEDVNMKITIPRRARMKDQVRLQ